MSSISQHEIRRHATIVGNELHRFRMKLSRGGAQREQLMAEAWQRLSPHVNALRSAVDSNPAHKDAMATCAKALDAGMDMQTMGQPAWGARADAIGRYVDDIKARVAVPA